MPTKAPTHRPARLPRAAPSVPKHRIYGAAHKRLRQVILSRDPWCKLCDIAPSNEMDHIVPLSRGGTNDDDNLQGVCKRCHSKKTMKELGTLQ